MIKKYFVILLISAIYCIQSIVAQEKINISLSKKIGGGQPNNINYLNLDRSIKNTSLFILPKNSNEFRIFEVPLQKEQYIYNKSMYRPKDMTKEDWDNYFSLDTTNLYKGKLQNIAHFFVSLKGLKKIIIYDANFNNDFTDDKTLEFDTRNSFKVKGFQDDIVGNEISIKYDFFDGKKVVEKIVHFEVEPYNPIFTVNKTHPNAKFYFNLKNNSHLEGNFTWKNQEYTVFIGSASFQHGRYERYNITIVEKGKDIDIKNIKKHNDNLEIRSTVFKQSLSLDSNLLRLIVEKKSNDNELAIAPNFQVKTLSNTNIQLKKFSNQYVLLDFWGTWCVPCVKSLPKIKKISDKYNNKVKVIGIAYDEDETKVTAFLYKNAYTWDNVFDSRNRITPNSIVKLYDIGIFPTYILVDKNQKIIYKGSNIDDLLKIIKKL